VIVSKIVIVHPEMGIYLGNCMGLGFFSNLDCAGQIFACVFPSENDAREHIRSWESANNPEGYRYVKVTCDQWADIDALDAAGLSEFTGPMKDARLRAMAPAGRA
jgi:hypothetical protein